MTSKLQNKTSSSLISNFGRYDIKENFRPSWLTNGDGNCIELDFYIEDLQIAIEVNGRQHYEYVPHFHNSYDDFIKQQTHDDIKKIVCLSRGINLIEIASSNDLSIALAHIKTVCQEKENYASEEDIKAMKSECEAYIKSCVGNKIRTLNKAVGRCIDSMLENDSKHTINQRKQTITKQLVKLEKERTKARRRFVCKAQNRRA